MIELYQYFDQTGRSDLLGNFESLEKMLRYIKRNDLFFCLLTVKIFQLNKENKIEKKIYKLDDLIIKCDVCKGQSVIGREHLKFRNEYKPCFRCNDKKYIIKKEIKNDATK